MLSTDPARRLPNTTGLPDVSERTSLTQSPILPAILLRMTS